MAPDAETLALQALAFVVSDERLGPRLLTTTGLDAADLRSRAGDPSVLAAVLDFLAGHEPDLVACADALGVKPDALTAARERLTA